MILLSEVIEGMMKKLVGFILITVLVLLAGYLLTGFYVMQPIGAFPDGFTVWYMRAGTGMRFIESADGMALKNDGQVSLFSRMTYMAKAAINIQGRIIAQFPYNEGFYLMSTGGSTFEN